MAGQFDLKWQPVQASDSSRLLAASQEATDAYSKAIKDQIKVFDTMFNNAQQHKMNEVQQAMNALSLEEYTAPDARAKFDESIANAFKAIGGINAANRLTLDAVWDGRGNVLSKRALDQYNLNDEERKDKDAEDKAYIDDEVGKFSTLGVLARQAKTDEERSSYLGMQQGVLEDVIGRGYEYYTKFQRAYKKFETDDLTQEGSKETARTALAKIQGEDFAQQADALITSQAGLDQMFKEGKISETDYQTQSKSIADTLQKINGIIALSPSMKGYFASASEALVNSRQDRANAQAKLNSNLEYNTAKTAALYGGLEVAQGRLALDAQGQQYDEARDAQKDAAKAIQGSIDDKTNAIMSELGKPWESSRGEIKQLFNSDGKIDPSKSLKLLQTIVQRVAKAEATATNQIGGTYTEWLSSKEGQATYKLFTDKQGTWNDVSRYINNNSKNSSFTTQEKIALIKAAAAGEFNQYATGNNKGVFDRGRMWLNDSVSDTDMTNWLSNYRQQQRQQTRTKNQQDIALFMAQTGAYIDGGWDSIISANPKTFSSENMQIYTRGRNINSTMSPNGAAQGHPAYRPNNTSETSTKTYGSFGEYLGNKILTNPVIQPIGTVGNLVKKVFD